MGSEEQRLKLLCKFNLSALSLLPDKLKPQTKNQTNFKKFLQIIFLMIHHVSNLDGLGTLMQLEPCHS